MAKNLGPTLKQQIHGFNAARPVESTDPVVLADNQETQQDLMMREVESLRKEKLALEEQNRQLSDLANGSKSVQVKPVDAFPHLEIYTMFNGASTLANGTVCVAGAGRALTYDRAKHGDAKLDHQTLTTLIKLPSISIQPDGKIKIYRKQRGFGDELFLGTAIQDEIFALVKRLGVDIFNWDNLERVRNHFEPIGYRVDAKETGKAKVAGTTRKAALKPGQGGPVTVSKIEK